jgi:hypothetical protein
LNFPVGYRSNDWVEQWSLLLHVGSKSEEFNRGRGREMDSVMEGGRRDGGRVGELEGEGWWAY